MDAYNMNKKLTTSLLALYDSTSEINGSISISYDQAYTLLDSFSDAFSLDHLLVQSPKADDMEYKYYKDDANSVLVLKSGHDFPTSFVVDGMDYDIFTSQVLNKIGNLRIYYRDKNSGRQNTAIALKEYQSFNTYNDIETRGKELVDVILDKCIPQPQVDITTIQKTSKRRVEASYPKMDKLIEFKIVNPGDKLYVISGTMKPEETEAELVDEKYVLYNGEKMTLNTWGCKITGWKSIRIYDHVAIVGETETLHEKRLAYMRDHNEA